MRWARVGASWQSACGRYRIDERQLCAPRVLTWRGRRYATADVVSVVSYWDGARTLELGSAGNGWDAQEFAAQHARQKEGGEMFRQTEEDPAAKLRALAQRIDEASSSTELAFITTEVTGVAHQLLRLALEVATFERRRGAQC